MVTILMLTGKLATPGVPKIEIFQNKGYDVMVSDYDITNKNFIAWLRLYFRCGHVTKVW